MKVVRKDIPAVTRVVEVEPSKEEFVLTLTRDEAEKVLALAGIICVASSFGLFNQLCASLGHPSRYERKYRAVLTDYSTDKTNPIINIEGNTNVR